MCKEKRASGRWKMQSAEFKTGNHCGPIPNLFRGLLCNPLQNFNIANIKNDSLNLHCFRYTVKNFLFTII
jgi:hypothetical protein